MKILLVLTINVLIVGLFLFSKLTPFKSKLTGSYLKSFLLFEKIFKPFLNVLKNFASPIQVGTGIAVDMSQIILLLILLLLNAYL